jgi:hypothetical protein
LCVRGADDAELGCCNSHGSSAKKAAAMPVDFL